MGMVSSNRQSSALEKAAAEQRASAEAMADANRYQSDLGLQGTQLEALLANEKTKNYYAGLQAGILIIGIVAVGIMALVKRTKN
jgi:hypothetical protein